MKVPHGEREDEKSKPMMHEPEKSRLRHSSNEASEQSRATGGGAGGAKGGDREEHEPAKARAGRRTGKACHGRWVACDEPQRYAGLSPNTSGSEPDALIGLVRICAGGPG